MRSVEALYRYLKRAAAPRFQSGSRSAADGRLAIYDDLFPHPISGFRFAEFMTYLEHLPGSHIYTTGGSLPLIQEPRSLPMVLAGFDAAHPQCAGRVEEYQQHSVELAATSVYCVFVNNAASIIGD